MPAHMDSRLASRLLDDVLIRRLSHQPSTSNAAKIASAGKNCALSRVGNDVIARPYRYFFLGAPSPAGRKSCWHFLMSAEGRVVDAEKGALGGPQ